MARAPGVGTGSGTSYCDGAVGRELSRLPCDFQYTKIEVRTTKMHRAAGIWIAALAILAMSPALFAQEVPDPSQTQFIIEALDTDSDGKISKSEATDEGMRQNFSFFDSDGDGGIDAQELKTVLTMLAGQNADPAPSADDSGEPFGAPDRRIGQR